MSGIKSNYKSFVKFRYSEKATTIWCKHPHGFDVTVNGQKIPEISQKTKLTFLSKEFPQDSFVHLLGELRILINCFRDLPTFSLV